ncbi:hypothetical protein [Paracoccus beibuensis]|uniref:hypothetical protein n=1 Tax=Paracoccus beibuensis TaxID=547602 RepID=UPI00223F8085|nr:hypothetical protein [Paracoccus beibuensis]
MIPRAAALLVATATPSYSQEATDAFARVRSAVQVELSDTHIGTERAVLVQSADPDTDAADLHVFTSSPDDRAGSPIAFIPAVAYAGRLGGQTPWLEVAENGSLLIQSEQIGIGRHPWSLTLTVAERDGQILLAGLTHATWDRATAASVSCDWNLLSGRWRTEWERADQPEEGFAGQRGDDTGRVARRLTLAEWAEAGQQVPRFCFHDFGD